MESHVSEELFKTYQKKKQLKNIKKKSKIKKYLNFHKKHVELELQTVTCINAELRCIY
jgi:hypothetical protein